MTSADLERLHKYMHEIEGPKPVTRVPETPPLTRTRAGFSFWRMTRLSAQLPGGLLNSQIDRSAESAHRKLSGSLW